MVAAPAAALYTSVLQIQSKHPTDPGVSTREVAGSRPSQKFEQRRLEGASFRRLRELQRIRLAQENRKEFANAFMIKVVVHLVVRQLRQLQYTK